MTGQFGKSGEWSEGIYENRYVRSGGRWRIASLHFYPTFQSDYDQGWSRQARPVDEASAALPPDLPPTQRYSIYPAAHVPPFHYRNPVTGQRVTYPSTNRGGPDAAAAEAALQTEFAAPALRVPSGREAAQLLKNAERDVARCKDVHAIENVESSYGYYLDKNLWDPLADLFARDGSIELAMRGVYRGARVREFLWKTFGRGAQGPLAGRLGNHLQLQPVISVAKDGQTAQVRLRMLQQMSFGARASLGASIYENELVKEDGRWKFSKVNTYNTLAASYDGGWVRGAGRGMPGISAEIPPDAPPTRSVVMFPLLFNTPYHFANPVSGRTAIPPLPSIDQQLLLFPLPPVAAPAAPQTTGVSR
jgi:hypothetical protein